MSPVAAMCGRKSQSQESAMQAILPIVIMLVVFAALNKAQTGRFF
jgi:hypothetical protein